MNIICIGNSTIVKSIHKVLKAFGYDPKLQMDIPYEEDETILLFTDVISDHPTNINSEDIIHRWRNPVIYLRMNDDVGNIQMRNPLGILAKGSDIPSLIINLPDDVPNLLIILLNWILQVEEVWRGSKRK